tara:strand:+ start:23356 stop:25947 length:2592 start_codon:yes stop_codon:yes gene_type:complete
MKIEDQIDLDRFEEGTRNLIERRAIANAESEVSDKVLENLIGRIEDEFEDTDLTIRKIKHFLSRVYEWTLDVDEIFNKDEGMVSNFLYDGRDIGSIVTTTNRSRMKPLVVTAINDARRITLTTLALENKESILEAFKIAMNKKASRAKIITPIVSPEEKIALQKIVNLLEGMSDEDIKEAKKITFEGLTKLENSLVNISIMPAPARKEYYEYWKDVEDKFLLFTGVLGATADMLDYLKQNMGGNVSMRGDEHKKENETYSKTEIEKLLDKSLLPSYIIECSPITITDDSDEKIAFKLVKDYLELIGKEMKTKVIDIKEQVTSQIQGSIREDYDAEGGGSSTSFDPTIGDELQDDIDEQEEKAKLLSKEKDVDPLFAILINNNFIAGEYDSNILDIARDELKEILNYEDLGILQEEIKDIVNTDIDKFLNSYEQTFSLTESTDTFYFPCMDSKEVVSFFDNVKATFTVAFLITGDEGKISHKSRSFNKYSEVVEFINENTKTFFSYLGSVVQLVHGITAISTKPYAPKGYGTKGSGGTPVQELGGITEGNPTRLPKVAADRMEKMKPLMSLIEEYHIKPLSGNKVLLEDVPEFYTSKEFKDFPILLTSSNVNQARKAITMGATPVVEAKHYRDLNKFLEYIRYPDGIDYTDKVKEIFEDGLNAYTNFWAHSDSIVDNDNILSGVIDSAEIVFGNSLYEIALATMSPKEVGEIDFEDRPLPFWNQEMKNKNPTIESLLTLIESDEWAIYVENSIPGSGIKRQNEVLLRNLKESDKKLTGELTHAMLDATDMIRKMGGKSVYSADLDVGNVDDISYVINLIEKEDNIDIYGIDIYNILKSQSSFNDIADTNRLSTEVVYKIKGLFR